MFQYVLHGLWIFVVFSCIQESDLFYCFIISKRLRFINFFSLNLKIFLSPIFITLIYAFIITRTWTKIIFYYARNYTSNLNTFSVIQIIILPIFCIFLRIQLYYSWYTFFLIHTFSCVSQLSVLWWLKMSHHLDGSCRIYFACVWIIKNNEITTYEKYVISRWIIIYMNMRSYLIW